jgi:hypothetical protein
MWCSLRQSQSQSGQSPSLSPSLSPRPIHHSHSISHKSIESACADLMSRTTTLHSFILSPPINPIPSHTLDVSVEGACPCSPTHPGVISLRFGEASALSPAPLR